MEIHELIRFNLGAFLKNNISLAILLDYGQQANGLISKRKSRRIIQWGKKKLSKATSCKGLEIGIYTNDEYIL